MLEIVYAEQNLLSYLIKYPAHLPVVEERFYVTASALAIHKALNIVVDEGLPLNARSIASEASKITSGIDEERVGKLFEIEVNEETFNFLYKSVRKLKAQELIKDEISNDLIKESAKKELDVEKLTQIKDSISEALEEISGKESLLLTPEIWLNRYEENMKSRRSGHFYSTGDSSLDAHLTTGFEPGYFNLLAANSGIGKSTFALMLDNKCINKQIPSMRVSNEMTEISDMDRLIGMRNKIPIEMFYPKNTEEGIPDHIFEILKLEREKFARSKFFRYVYTPKLSIDELESLIVAAKKEMGVDYLRVTVDLLTKLEDFQGDNKASRYEDAVNKLDEMVKRTRSCLFGIIQLKRPPDSVRILTVEDLEKLRPRVEDIKNSGALEERARIVMTMFRSKHFASRYLKDTPEYEVLEDIAEIEIVKQNLGHIGGRSKYLFEGQCAVLTPYVESEEA